MAAIKLKLDTSYERKDGNYNLYIQINHGNTRRKISVGYKIKDGQLKNGRVVGHPKAAVINAKIASLLAEADQFIAEASLANRPVNIELIGTGYKSHNFCDYLRHRAKQYNAIGKIVMKRKLNRFAKEFNMCFKRDIFFDDVNADLLRTFESWLKNRGNVSNTRHKKFKFLSQFFNNAFDEGLTHSKNPFKDYKINKEPVKKEKLTFDELAAIENLKLKKGAVNDARNMFLFAYYCKGARFENCLTMRREQIIAGRIVFQTNKGKNHISVKIHSKLNAILDQYSDGDIIFPYLSEIPDSPEKYLRAIDSNNVIVNRNLKDVALLADISKNLTFHMARHSFAYHMKGKTNSINIIQDSLGHKNQRTTEIYLKALDDEILDKELEKLYGE